MNTTSQSLLLRAVGSDPSAWDRIVSLYTPLIRGWLRRRALLLHDHDTEDLVQEVLAAVLCKLPAFLHSERKGAFRAWLRTITVNCLRESWRAQRLRPRATGSTEFREMLEQLEDPTSSLSRQWDAEHDRHVLSGLLAMVEPDFDEQTLRAFRRRTFEGVSAREVAAGLGMSEAAVFAAKARVLRRLREVAEGLIE